MIGFDDVVKSTGTDLLAFFISRGMIKTGLGRRVGLLFMRWMGRRTIASKRPRRDSDPGLLEPPLPRMRRATVQPQ